jgi:ribosomal protein S27AE
MQAASEKVRKKAQICGRDGRSNVYLALRKTRQICNKISAIVVSVRNSIKKLTQYLLSQAILKSDLF